MDYEVSERQVKLFVHSDATVLRNTQHHRI